MTIEGMPWVAVPFKGDRGELEAKVPSTGFPTLGLINGMTGEVIEQDCFKTISLDYIK